MKRFFYLFVIATLSISWSLQANLLTFSSFKLKYEGKKTQIKVNNKGVIKMGGELIGIVHKDGKLTSKDGQLIASISPDGILADATGKALVKIDKTGKIDNGSGMYIQWSNDGVFMKGEENTGITIAPVDENSFQTASLILFLYLSFK
ncbi:MAG: hypothetical protein N4A35_06115 [Flavobacteriales bacterium]|jgi:hypothetical protein|nr:hypothetical protein [Flavobacteriales bacterium]